MPVVTQTKHRRGNAAKSAQLKSVSAEFAARRQLPFTRFCGSGSGSDEGQNGIGSGSGSGSEPRSPYLLTLT
jgi:hypothetical protein